MYSALCSKVAQLLLIQLLQLAVYDQPNWGARYLVVNSCRPAVKSGRSTKLVSRYVAWWRDGSCFRVLGKSCWYFIPRCFFDGLTIINVWLIFNWLITSEIVEFNGQEKWKNKVHNCDYQYVTDLAWSLSFHPHTFRWIRTKATKTMNTLKLNKARWTS